MSKKPDSRLADVLRILKGRPGRLYTLPELGRLMNCDPRAAGRACAVLVQRGAIIESWGASKARYGIAQPASGTEVAAVREIVYRGELRGYDTAMRRFAEMCVAGRS